MWNFSEKKKRILTLQVPMRTDKEKFLGVKVSISIEFTRYKNKYFSVTNEMFSVAVTNTEYYSMKSITCCEYVIYL